MKTTKQMTSIINLLSFNGACTLTKQGDLASINDGLLVANGGIRSFSFEAFASIRLNELLASLTRYDFVRLELTKDNAISVYYCQFVNMLVYARFNQEETIIFNMNDKKKYIVRA